MSSITYAQHPALAAAAARPFAGLGCGFAWRSVVNQGFGLDSNIEMNGTSTATKRPARHLGRSST
jgi:hypothetical protein